MCKAVYQIRSGLKHHIHLLILPQCDNFCIGLNGSVYFVMRALKERCATNLRILTLRCYNWKIIITTNNLNQMNPINSYFYLLKTIFAIFMSLYFRSNHYLPPHHFVEFFKSFPNLTHIDLWGSIIDDIGINSIGEFIFNPHVILQL